LHVYNSPIFKFNRFVKVDSEHISHMSYNVVRVPRGSFGRVTENMTPKLLAEGLHVVDNPIFEYRGIVNMSDQYIKNGTVHVIQVAKGSLGLIMESSFPRLLEEGVHIFDSPTLEYVGVKSKLSKVIRHGTITRFRVEMGEVGLAWDGNNPLLIEEPGTYLVDNSTFKFVSAKSVNEKFIELGAQKMVTVYSGEVGVSYKAGALTILESGRHIINRTDHFFETFLSLQQRAMRLRPSEDVLICETRDLVKIGIVADVFFRVADPMQAISEVGIAGIDKLVEETSIATLTNIMRGTCLNDIAQNSPNPTVKSEKSHLAEQQQAAAVGAPSAPLFFDRAHDAFLAKLHDDFLEKYGLFISNIRIEKFKLLDSALSDSISKQALITAQTESQLANLAGKTQIATTEQERKKRVDLIEAEAAAATLQTQAEAKVAQAEADARALQVRAEADAARLRVQAEAEAYAVKVRAEATIAEAEAEAQSTKIRATASISQAEADAEGIRVRSEAEADRAEKLGATSLGEKVALLNIYADVVKASNDGVSKVVYVDPSTTQAANPLGLLTLQSLQNDLTGLGASKGAPQQK